MNNKKSVGRPKTRGETVPLNLRIEKNLAKKIELYSNFSGYTKTQICEALISKGLDSLITQQLKEIEKWEAEKDRKADIFNNFKFKL